MASGLGTTHPNQALHPGRKVTREDHEARNQIPVTGPGLQAHSIDPSLGRFERLMMERGL